MRTAATATLRTLPRAALRAGGAFGWIRAQAAKLSPGARHRLLAAAAAALVLVLGYYGWFRDSSFVEVRDVTVIGVTSADAPRVRARLEHAARQMSTLHFDEEALRGAIGPGISVAEIRVRTDFPHGMRIEVVEHPPVAVLVAPGRRVPVAADGTLLPKVRARDIPSIAVGTLPSGAELRRGRALRLVGAAAAAPAPLRRRITRFREQPGKGLVAYLRRGPQIILGDTAALRAKWAAAAAILADGTSRGATYVDVRFPDRPVAGGVDVPQPEPEQPPAGAGAQQPPAPGAPAPVPGTTQSQPQQQGTTPGAAPQGAAQSPTAPAPTNPQPQVESYNTQP